MKNPLVYIHDLDINNEKHVRQLMLKSGAANALLVRFTESMHDADIWVLRADSALLQYPGKLTAPVVWLYENGTLFNRDEAHSVLTPERIASVLEQGLARRAEQVKAEVNNQAVAGLLERCRQGLAAGEGGFSICHEDAIVSMDFGSGRALLNEAAMLGIKKRQLFIARFREYAGDHERLKYGANLRQVLWILAMGNGDKAQHDLLMAAGPGTRLRIPRWPNLSGLPCKPEDYGIISLLNRKPLGLKDVVALLDADAGSAAALMNALYLCNFAEIENGGSSDAQSAQREKRKAPLVSLWRKLRSAA